MDVVIDLPAISPDATILAIPLNELVLIKKEAYIRLIPLLALNGMKLVEPELIVKSVAPLFATSENCILVALQNWCINIR